MSACLFMAASEHPATLQVARRRGGASDTHRLREGDGFRRRAQPILRTTTHYALYMRADLPDGQITYAVCCTSKRVQPFSQKFSAFAVGQINFRTRAVSCPPEGRIAIVTTRWARDAMDAAASGSMVFGPDENAAAYGEVVWS